MVNPWIEILRKLKLSKAEESIFKKYEQDPDGRSFLPLSDVLRAHGKINESIELLTQGVERHPGFTVARVVLARELLNKGLIMDSWYTLEESPTNLEKNVLAQKLKFKILILLRKEKFAYEILQHMQKNNMLDDEINALAHTLNIAGIDTAQKNLIQIFNSQGITLEIPVNIKDEELSLAYNKTISDDIDSNKLVQSSSTHSDKPLSASYNHNLHEVSPSDNKVIDNALRLSDQQSKNYYVMSLSEIFKGENKASLLLSEDANAEGLELDSTTLADIYANQGHYGKAIAIYKRLLKLNPSSDFLKKRIMDLIDLEKKQKMNDFAVDPNIVDQMETADLIDRQLKILNKLLSVLK